MYYSQDLLYFYRFISRAWFSNLLTLFSVINKRNSPDVIVTFAVSRRGSIREFSCKRRVTKWQKQIKIAILLSSTPKKQKIKALHRAKMAQNLHRKRGWHGGKLNKWWVKNYNQALELKNISCLFKSNFQGLIPFSREDFVSETERHLLNIHNGLQWGGKGVLLYNYTQRIWKKLFI